MSELGAHASEISAYWYNSFWWQEQESELSDASDQSPEGNSDLAYGLMQSPNLPPDMQLADRPDEA